jgi:hypothetical protein
MDPVAIIILRCQQKMGVLRLPALSRAVARAERRTAIARLRQPAVGTYTGLSMDAPEKSVVRSRNRRIAFGKNELALPAQRWAQIRVMNVEAIRFRNHAAPPAFRTARFTATRASWTLYLL